MLNLTFALSAIPRLDPLIDGTVKPTNMDLQLVMVPPSELFYRNLKYDEFDVFEMSISESLMARERGNGSRWQWIGLPVFFSKAFVWLNMYVNTGANISHPRDLKGKRVGVPDYTMTAALWMRIILKDLYGISPTDIDWVLGRTKEFSHGGILGFDKEIPPGLSIRWLTEDQAFDVMLDRGELDAAYGFLPHPEARLQTLRALDRYGHTPIEGNPRIRKLFPDGGREIITEYYRKTGVVPVNHLIAVQSRILEREPWVALELYRLFQGVKETAYERARRMRSAYLLFEGDDYRSQSAIFGEDPYPFGVRENRKMIEILFRNSFEEKLTRSPARIEDVFYKSTLDT